MKKLLLILLPITLFLCSCGGGEEDIQPINPISESIEERIVGITWQLFDNGGGWFRLNEDYTYSIKDNFCDFFVIKGQWSLNDNVIESRFYIGPIEFIENCTIVEYNDSLLKIRPDTLTISNINLLYESCNPEPIRGCMDSVALNYNSEAECPYSVDSCEYTSIYGCTDIAALNYNPIANIDDGSCCYLGGCIDPNAVNYDPNACFDDGSCCYLSGCIDPNAINYLLNACFDDSSCLYIGDTHQGGIIFYSDGNGMGLIATDGLGHQDYKNWGCMGTSILGADGVSIGTGAQNTLDIELGCINFGGNNTTHNAANTCANLVYNGYSDWYLPSIWELAEMYQGIGPGNTIGLGNIFNFNVNDSYWSSSEAGGLNESTQAYILNFAGPNLNITSNKDNYYYIRPIRTFSY